MKDKWTTKDNKGRIYHHIGGDVVSTGIICNEGTNTHCEGKLNLALRNGESKFGDEIIFQLIIDKVVQKYSAVSPLNHLEIYFSRENAVEMFEKMLEILKDKKQIDKIKEWSKDRCERCGEHNICPNCNKYTWSRTDKNI